MATLLADSKPVDHDVITDAVERPVTGCKAAKSGRQMTAARGIAIAVLISVPFWMLVALTVYKRL